MSTGEAFHIIKPILDKGMKNLFTKQKIHRVFGSLIKKGFTILMIGVPVTVLYSQNRPVPLKPVDKKRVEEIMVMLSDQPAGYGDPCDKREVWNKLLQSGKYDRFLREMDHFSFPPFSKEDYFSLSEGTAASSSRGLSMMRNRASGLARVTWAECLENNGR